MQIRHSVAHPQAQITTAGESTSQQEDSKTQSEGRNTTEVTTHAPTTPTLQQTEDATILQRTNTQQPEALPTSRNPESHKCELDTTAQHVHAVSQSSTRSPTVPTSSLDPAGDDETSTRTISDSTYDGTQQGLSGTGQHRPTTTPTAQSSIDPHYYPRIGSRQHMAGVVDTAPSTGGDQFNIITVLEDFLPAGKKHVSVSIDIRHQIL